MRMQFRATTHARVTAAGLCGPSSSGAHSARSRPATSAARRGPASGRGPGRIYLSPLSVRGDRLGFGVIHQQASWSYYDTHGGY